MSMTDPIADFLTRRIARRAQQMMRGHQNSRRTEAALQSVSLMKRFLDIGNDATVAQAFDGFDVCAIRLHGKHQTGVHRQTIEQNEASPARPHFATEMRARQLQIPPQKIRKRFAW